MTAALTSPAGAQDPVGPSGNYGGGRAPSPSVSIGAAGSALVALRVRGNRVQVNALAGAGCAYGLVRATATLKADGSFAVSGTGRRARDGVRQSTQYRISGTIAGAAASGILRVSNRVVRRGETIAQCVSGIVEWTARRPAGDLGMVGAQPRAVQYGTTSQRHDGPREAIVLRVSADATRLGRAIYGFSFRCGSRRHYDLLDAPRPSIAIAADGRVRDTEHHTYRHAASVTRVTERFAGHIGAAGSSGTFSVRSRTVSRRTGRTIEDCDSGTVSWRASS